jgi:mono/diheme cytochrome c family protein
MPKIDLSHKKLELLTLFIGSMNSYRQGIAQASDSASPRMPTPLSKFVSPPNATIETERNYRLYCVQCHGSQGNGRGVNNTAGGLSVSPRNHLLASEMSELKDDEIKSAITLGGDAVQKSGLMPGWGNTLGENQIDELVLYLRKLCQCKAGDKE